MFGWRRKNEGFVWNKYVRTVVVQRRKARRERLERAREAAIEGAKDAGVAAGELAVKGARGAGAGAARAAAVAGRGMKVSASAAGRGLRQSALAAGRGIRLSAVAAGRGAKHAALAAAAGTAHLAQKAQPHAARALQPLLDIFARPGVALPLLLAGSVAMVSALARPAMGQPLGRDGVIALAIGVACLLAVAIPRLLMREGPGIGSQIMPILARIPVRARTYAAVAVACLALVVGAALTLPGHISTPTLNLKLSSFTLFGSEPPITGRANVLSADTLRIGSTVVRLAGIEAPARDQTCMRAGNRRWRCGIEASSALSRLVDGRAVTCERSGSGDKGTVIGICRVGKTEIGAALVKDGHVFAEDAMLARYSSQQAEARTARRGLWQAENPERPAAYRARLWQEAKARAPDGCPIKGTIARRRGESGKVYHLPWTPSYQRVRVRTTRGERWFCSEAQAMEAGFRPSGTPRPAGDS